MEEKIDVIKKIFINSLKNNSLLQVGSSTLKDKYNDIDFLIISEDVFETKDILLKYFNKYETKQIDDSIKITNFFDVEISFAIYEKKYFLNLIEKYNSGQQSVISEHKTWTIGYWLIEGFISDLKNSKIIIDNHNLYLIKKIVSKKAIYGEKRIIIDCLDEINIKNKILNNCKNELESQCLKIDILYAVIRSLSIIDNKPMRGFKNIKKNISKLSLKYQNIINKLFDENNIDNVINILKDYLIKKSLYMGTWQFNGSFKTLSDDNIIKLLKYAKKLGINKFDTALVYGTAEKCIGKVINNKDIVLTKVPARVKPPINEIINLYDFYDKEYIYNCVNKSLKNLNRKYIDILLLHNWNNSWNNSFEIIEWLCELKEKNIVKKIGISLPNGYNHMLDKKILCYIDVIETPYNDDDKYIEKYLSIYKKYNIEIILRSLFIQGKIIKKDKTRYIEILSNAKKMETSIVIGMTDFKQIKENIDNINNVNI